LANELQITYTGSVAPYAMIRRRSDRYVWNGSAFVAFVNGDIAGYDIPLTSGGGDYYSADFPTDIATGVDYDVVYYEYAAVAGTPTIADLVLDRRAVRWGGVTTASLIGGADWYYADQQDVVDLIGSDTLRMISNEPTAASDTAANTNRIQRTGEFVDAMIDGRLATMGYVTPLEDMSAATELIMANLSAGMVVRELNRPRQLLNEKRPTLNSIDMRIRDAISGAEGILKQIGLGLIQITATRRYDRKATAKVYTTTTADGYCVLP
jgi:hypothetical protein